jgi:hypothetical protein
MQDEGIIENEAVIRIPMNSDNIREELNFYKTLKNHFREYGKNADDIDFIIRNLEDQIAVFNSGSTHLPDEEKFMTAIEKHPYFKNPCDYPIRLLTILKYLKRRGFNMNYADIDLYVDKIIQKMDGVRKVGRGLYKRQRNSGQ